MRENRPSGSMRGRRNRATPQRACALLYPAPTKRAEEVTRVGPTARPWQEVEEAIAEACRGGYDVWGTSHVRCHFDLTCGPEGVHLP